MRVEPSGLRSAPQRSITLSATWGDGLCEPASGPPPDTQSAKSLDFQPPKTVQTGFPACLLRNVFYMRPLDGMFNSSLNGLRWRVSLKPSVSSSLGVV